MNQRHSTNQLRMWYLMILTYHNFDFSQIVTQHLLHRCSYQCLASFKFFINYFIKIWEDSAAYFSKQLAIHLDWCATPLRLRAASFCSSSSGAYFLASSLLIFSVHLKLWFVLVLLIYIERSTLLTSTKFFNGFQMQLKQQLCYIKASLESFVH